MERKDGKTKNKVQKEKKSKGNDTNFLYVTLTSWYYSTDMKQNSANLK